MLVLVRRDDPESKVELLRWQPCQWGWFGYSRQMILNRRRPAIFLRSVWEPIETKKEEGAS
jgi:hypothetical protein